MLSVFSFELKTSVIKPIDAKWLVKTHECLVQTPGMIRSAFEKCGVKFNDKKWF